MTMKTEPENRAECPVAALIPEAESLIDAYAATDAAHGEAVRDPKTDERQRAAFRLDIQIKLTFDYLDRVKHRASFLKATSARGALFQLCLINALTCDLETYAADEDRGNAAEAEHAIDRMLYSIAGFIEHETGEKMEDACSDYFMARRLNPHAIVAAALALAKSDNEGA
jgi:hypothetical protein